MEKQHFFLLLLCLAIVVIHSANAQVPAVFILGDSTADTGTNNFLNDSSTPKANFPPYGIDFPHSRPTGRFSNGLNSADFLTKLLGFKRSPVPYFVIEKNTKFIKRPSFRGANFASGGSGILDITGQQMLGLPFFGYGNNASDAGKNVVTLSEQIEQFSWVCSNLTAIKGAADAETFLSKSLFFFSVGSNDLFGYYYSKSGVSREQFLSSLGQTYENHLRNIIKLGARKIGIFGIPPVGCCPSQRFFNQSGGCLEELNSLAVDFQGTINSMMGNLSSEYKDLKYSIGNAYAMTINVINNPRLFGFRESKSACCGNGAFNGGGICDSSAKLCPKRQHYLFWDMFHPTKAASKLAASTLFYGDSRFAAPINVKQLAEA
ncbi:hypothetical protein Tsubulata_006136 [Turnera subulata]|uniref:Uncharacterized protein n=1 Tax=Turnera subulata TaxID=218843 RepID=A0A9Q0F8H2_9ROSI|nr:hypothetical protein Tsubulata_006136 [Turnera subulata]